MFPKRNIRLKGDRGATINLQARKQNKKGFVRILSGHYYRQIVFFSTKAIII